MALLTVPRSHNLLASFVCATALACGGGDEQPQGGPPLGSTDAAVVGDAQPGQVVQPAATDAGTGMVTAVVDGSAVTPIPVVDAGPPDLGENSQGDTFFRADTLVLKAPNLYVTVLFQIDATQNGQDELNKALTIDSDMNGFVDMSLLLRFLKTASPKGANGQVTPGGALCPLPLGPTAACGADKTFPFQAPPLVYTNNAQACALQGTQETAAPPCFSTTPASLTMQLPILGAVPLQDGQLVGTWDGANISNGLVRGFLPKTVATATKLGAGLPDWLAAFDVKEGAPLVNFLSNAQMQKNSRGEDGWWFLLSYTAKAAKFDPSIATP